MEARRKLKDQEIFYARLDGRHVFSIKQETGLSYYYTTKMSYFNSAGKPALKAFEEGYSEAHKNYFGFKSADSWSDITRSIRGVCSKGVEPYEPAKS